MSLYSVKSITIRLKALRSQSGLLSLVVSVLRHFAMSARKFISALLAVLAGTPDIAGTASDLCAVCKARNSLIP